MIYYIDKSELPSFTYGAKSSTSFNFIITEDDHLNAFENDYEEVEVPGRTGNLIIDNGRKKNKNINLVAYVDLEGLGTAADISQQIETWLAGEVKYKTLIFSDGRSCEAITKSLVIKEEIKDVLYVELTFSSKKGA